MRKMRRRDTYVLKKNWKQQHDDPVTRYRYRRQVLEQVALLFCLCVLVMLLLRELLRTKLYIFLPLFLLFWCIN